jgi:hypothetical protein
MDRQKWRRRRVACYRFRVQPVHADGDFTARDRMLTALADT